MKSYDRYDVTTWLQAYSNIHISRAQYRKGRNGRNGRNAQPWMIAALRTRET